MHLAQVNIARFISPADDPVNQDFVDNIDRVNTLAEAAPGFIWRFQEYPEDDQPLYPDDPLMILNLSVWRDIESLMNFVYTNPVHKAFMGRRKEWFSRLKFHLALWWVAPGDKPCVEQAKQKLAQIAERGPSPSAFNFANTYNAQGEPIKIKLG